MLDSLRFVQGAVAKKDFVAALTHFQIKGGYVKGYNGSLALCASIDLGIEVSPKATSFIRAIDTCKEVIQISQTATGRLAIKSGKFRAYVDCIPDEFPPVYPEGDVIELPERRMLGALKCLLPFIAEDASRPWARGILLRDQSAFATNNVVLMEHWLGYRFPVAINIPRSAVLEMVRIGEEPLRMQVCENSVTFFYESDRWLKTNLYSLEWPDLAKVLNRDSKPLAIPDGLFDALEDIEPFVDKLRRVWLSPGKVSTDATDDAGALVEVPALASNGIYNIDYLLGLKGAVTTIDLTAYPGPACFFGDGVRGAIIGMRG